MTELNWQAKIHNHRGSFIRQDDLEEHSHVIRLLSGAEKFEDEHGWDGDSDPLGLINPLYAAEIEAIRQQCDDNETEKQRQENHIKDLKEKVAKTISEKQWVVNFKLPWNFPRFSSWTRQQQRFVVDMLARYWATGVPVKPHPSEARDVKRLTRYIADMRAEQEEYFEFARELNATQLSRYNFINPLLDHYIQRRMQNKILHMKSSYPGDYHQLHMLPLAPPAAQPPSLLAASPPLELGEVPVCVIPSLRRPTDVKRHTNFLEQFFPAEDVYPKERNKRFKPRDGTYLYKMPVSSDPNVALLSAQQEFEVVTTPSALKTLLDNSAPSWDRQWEVPVTVRLVPGTKPGTHRKVVFLDKPLPPRSMNSVERNTLVHKRTVRLLVCKRVTEPGPIDYSIWANQPDRRKTPQFKEKLAKKKKTRSRQQKRELAREQAEKQRQEEEEEETGQGLKRPRDDSLTSGEESEMGSLPDPDTPSTSAAQLDSDAAYEDSDSDDMGLQIDCADDEEPEEQDEEPEEEPEEGQKEEPGEEGGRTEEEEGQTGEEEGGRTEDEGGSEEEGSGKKSPCAERTSSSVYREVSPHPGSGLASNSAAKLLANRESAEAPSTQREASCTAAPAGTKAAPVETESAAAEQGEEAPQKDDVRFLRPPPGLNVHYRVWQLGGLRLLLRATTHGMRENPNAGLVRYTVHVKPAYQPGLGIEVMTRSEVISQWLDCLLRPNSRVVRVHLDPISQQVITPEERTLSQLTEEFAKYDTGFKPQYGLQVLESLLREVTSLAPGQYLLSHDSRAGAFARLSRAGDSSAPGSCSLHMNFPPWPVQVALESPRCLNIDPSILTPFNTRYGRVPATFRYRVLPELGEGGWKEYWSNMKKKGVTRKKKKNMKKSNGSRSTTLTGPQTLPNRHTRSREKPGSSVQHHVQD